MVALGAAGEHFAQLVAGDLVFAQVLGEVPAAEDQEAIADRVGVFESGRDEDDGGAALGGAADQAEHGGGLLDAEGGGGLVEHEHARAVIEGAGDGDGLALAAGEGAGGAVGVADFHVEFGHFRGEGGAGVAGVELAEEAPAVDGLGAEEEVAPEREEGDEGEVLVDGEDAERACAAGGIERDGVAVELDVPAAGLMDAAEGLDEDGLAGAVVAEHAGDFAGVEVDGDVFERGDLLEADAEVVDFDDGAALAGRVGGSAALLGRGVGCGVGGHGVSLRAQ